MNLEDAVSILKCKDGLMPIDKVIAATSCLIQRKCEDKLLELAFVHVGQPQEMARIELQKRSFRRHGIAIEQIQDVFTREEWDTFGTSG